MKKRKEVKCWVVVTGKGVQPFNGDQETSGWRVMAWNTRKAALQFLGQRGWTGNVRRATLIIED